MILRGRYVEKVKKGVIEFYEKLGVEELSTLALKNQNKQNNEHSRFLMNHLSKDQKILDLACGYGRLTIPLAKMGYTIEGIDLVPSHIKKALELAQKENLKISFRVDDMCALPYARESFDAIICMWSSFNHLLTQKDQALSLKEIVRVLRKNGMAIIDLPYFRKPTNTLQKLGKFLDNAHLFKRKFNNAETILFLHSRQSLEKALKTARITNYKINCVNLGGKKRLIVYLYKLVANH
jgi:ubiquinone/menaquinone biosynthesis C-methylase UbiE